MMFGLKVINKFCSMSDRTPHIILDMMTKVINQLKEWN